MIPFQTLFFPEDDDLWWSGCLIGQFVTSAAARAKQAKIEEQIKKYSRAIQKKEAKLLGYNHSRVKSIILRWVRILGAVICDVFSAVTSDISQKLTAYSKYCSNAHSRCEQTKGCSQIRYFGLSYERSPSNVLVIKGLFSAKSPFSWIWWKFISRKSGFFWLIGHNKWGEIVVP